MSRSDQQIIHQQLPQLTLSIEETKILAECEKESLIYRSIPLGLIGLFMTQFAIQRNILSVKMKFLKLGFGLFSGYILGKISYAPVCRKKILKQIPNSNLALAIQGIDPRISTQDSVDDNHDPIEHFAQNDQNEVVMRPQDLNDISRSRTVTDNDSFMRNSSTRDGSKGIARVNQYGDLIYDEQ
ncbi:unnamed protein product [Didymodactylos carnosus]|uniref:OCIA domain-containing protein n=1 Tax=Didymodactylos carnosus TaxID=1234261 RepID=A0A814CV67_9BILA|nr:unnamed protein product [Didymodactylos carnosus]CAF0945301.1 unnamed protein product [Didymodactylos carnosus]CAF3522374.1 unnamed protein product [Didymodactylos carnosus]CAF3721504.1 unnamed protein product [Didymodactylos carnosus]